ncbi:SPO1 DNA polymerase [Salinisphaera japonica YTM-1]|uniref:SPO1 DNA polymerase n=1 Tax=Salinisphaera japonica YTM-1 TaxID=1209778 RepID=A0A423PLV2_9GAMM|nr:uracil-DNA glycosylase family protein [Salinisphaera japonica]ROO26573.1 SPO1 DNA polymerase [Salinisphaera japonica YTM-1]
MGPVDAALLVVGLAPGLHGAHRTGRPFSGDDSGGLLFEMLHAYGWANQPVSTGPGDGLVLQNCRMTNAVKCLPPDNRPLGHERRACSGFLRAELRGPRVIVALGRLAHDAVLAALSIRIAAYPFGHACEHRLDDRRVLIDSYHCSRYNLNTRRLTRDGFAAVFAQARRRLVA